MTLILATDMARHSEIVERFKSKLDTFDFSNADYVGSVSRKSKKCEIEKVHDTIDRKQNTWLHTP